MTVSRHRNKEIYLKQKRSERRQMVISASCEEQAILGYLRRFQAEDQRDLARVRMTRADTRAERLMRRVKFLTILAKMAKRQDRILENFPG